MEEFTRESIIALLKELNTLLEEHGQEAELYIVGGSAMALTYDIRRTTADIDAAFLPRDVVLEHARTIAARHGLSPNWLSDGVTDLGFDFSADADPRTIEIGPALTVNVASPDYLLAMKVLSSRQSDADRRDAVALCRLMGLTNEAQIQQRVGRYFRVDGRTELFVEDIAAEL
ncbi:hypothetical protein SAMN05216355_10686 [Actinomyces ruminicola]|uniref:DUF6036 domain-containing protein n=1 Tax=Actinomyces ruminicola TaxID=332524 RepID=A0A1H0CB45_9ACTO|nr:DUF6036 family nucleotidyltransferase [Actinomyces ruminicola]SDN55144.1 hypothetical protein SAMN05216355_10686 [Actinomyces ruminicola]